MQVKSEVQPIQEAEAARIRSEVKAFTGKVADYGKTFRTRTFYKYSSGASKAYPEIDQVQLRHTRNFAGQVSQHCSCMHNTSQIA